MLKTKSAPLLERPCEPFTEYFHVSAGGTDVADSTSAKRRAASDLRTPVQQDISLKNDGFASGRKARNNADCESTVFYRCFLVVSVSAGELPYSGFLRRCISVRATSTRRLISSLALVPIASTCSRASREDSSGFSVAPSVCRLAISLRTAVIMNCARDSPLTRDESISLTTLCGKRALICCDLLFVALVTGFHPLVYCAIQHNTKMNTKKSLQCDSLLNNVNTIFVIYCDSVVKSKARRCYQHQRASNHNPNHPE